MSFTPIQFIPRSHQPTILASRITTIHAVGHTKVQPPGATTITITTTNDADTNNSATNHWCFYLKTPSSTITLDAQPTHTVPSTVLPAGSKATLLFSDNPSLTSGLPPDAQKVYKLDTVDGLTVQDVYNLIVRNGREKYEFNAAGTGCRMWVIEMLDLLFGQGFLVDSQQVQAAKGGVGRLWPEGTALETDRGAYYE